jgi:hypothetical protein
MSFSDSEAMRSLAKFMRCCIYHMFFSGLLRRIARYLLVAGVVVASGSRVAFGTGSVTLAWDPSTDPTIAGYNLYYGASSRSYTNVIPAGAATAGTISNLTSGATYYFAATSYTAAGLESDYSAELAYTLPGGGGNLAPTLDPIPDLTISENDGLQTVNLTGISAGLTGSNLTIVISAFSTNTALIPAPTVNYTSPNATGSLTFTPSPYSYGASMITVMVFNGAASSNTFLRSFLVTVLPVNIAPTIDPLNNVTINENAGLQTVNITGLSSGSLTETQTLTLTAVSANPSLIPNPAVSYTSPNPIGTLTFQPVANASGSALITVAVNDGQPTNSITTQSFTVTVNPIVITNTPSLTNWTLWWQNTNGALGAWTMDGTNHLLSSSLNPASVDPNWHLINAGDFYATGGTELLWQHTSGWLGVWEMNGTNCTQTTYLNPSRVAPGWQAMGTWDFNYDGHPGILWQQQDGHVAVWQMDGTNRVAALYLNPPQVDPGWRLVGTADLNGTGRADLLWEQNDGHVAIWQMNGTNRVQVSYLNPAQVDSHWSVVGTRDLNGDGRTDIIWQHSSGALGFWIMNGTNCVQTGYFQPNKVDPAWRIVGPK